MERFGRLGKDSDDLIDQAAVPIVGGTDGSSLSWKGILKERLFQIISVTTQVVISRRMNRYKPALRDGQAARGTGEEAGGLQSTAWGWDFDED